MLGIFTIHPELHLGPSGSVSMQQGTDRHTQTRMINIHFASSTTHTKCN